MHAFSYSEAWDLVSIRLIADELPQLLHLRGAISEAAIQSTYTRFVKELTHNMSNEHACRKRTVLSTRLYALYIKVKACSNELER